MAKDPGRALILLTFFLLGIYNILLALFLFGPESVKAGLLGFYDFVEDEFWLLTVLEVIGIISIFADIVLIYDNLKVRKRIVQLGFVGLFILLLFSKIVAYWFGFAFNKLSI